MDGFAKGAVLLLALNCSTSYANSDFRIESRVDALFYSPTMNWHGWFNDFEGDLKKGNISFAEAWTRNEIGYKAFNFGTERGLLYWVSHKKDTARFYQEVNSSNEFPENENFDVDLKLVNVSYNSFFIGYQHAFKNLEFLARYKWITVDKYIDGYIKGNASDINNISSSQLSTEYYYSEDPLFDRELENAPEGYGNAIDLKVYGDWKHTSLKLEVRDIYSRIEYNKAPTTKANINLSPDNQTVSATISGREYNKDVSQRLPYRASLVARSHFKPPLNAVLESHSINGHLIPKIGL